mmetsp:Transcript_28261/g.83662  ORF Transcript_28261/g.83662 Transcript_28261/m.83662 type:complete len:214 (-) Transcript_28261:1162-1803(-)
MQPQRWCHVADNHVERDGYPGRVGVGRIVLQLGEAVHVHIPEVPHDRHGRQHCRPNERPVDCRQVVDEREERRCVRVGPRAQHTVDPHKAVERRAEEPLIQDVVVILAGVIVSHQPRERLPHKVKHAFDVPEHQHKHQSQHHLDGKQPVVLVPVRRDAEACVHEHRVDSVHGADVVQHVAVAHDQAHDENEEVEAPHHLGKATNTVVARLVVV